MLRTMRTFSIVCLLLYASVCQAQNTNYKPYNEAAYPTHKYTTKKDTFKFHQFTIELTQARLKDSRTYDSTATYCRIWLRVKQGDMTLNSLFYDACESVGGCSGIYVSEAQPLNNYFLLSKYGDYDGRIIIIDKAGKLSFFKGGYYYISPDEKYLFSPYDSDLNGLTVYNLANNKMLYSSDTLPYRVTRFFYNKGNYFFIPDDGDERATKDEYVFFDVKSATFKRTLVSDNFKTGTELFAYHSIQYGPCNCGSNAPYFSGSRALDSMDAENSKSVVPMDENYVTKASVSLQDSSIYLQANMRLDHRFFGYAKPDLNSEKLLLFSIFTNDVEGNPFRCKLGAYYQTMSMDDIELKYVSSKGSFVEFIAIDKSGITTTVYFQKAWIVFE